MQQHAYTSVEIQVDRLVRSSYHQILTERRQSARFIHFPQMNNYTPRENTFVAIKKYPHCSRNSLKVIFSTFQLDNIHERSYCTNTTFVRPVSADCNAHSHIGVCEFAENVEFSEIKLQIFQRRCGNGSLDDLPVRLLTKYDDKIGG